MVDLDSSNKREVGSTTRTRRDESIAGLPLGKSPPVQLKPERRRVVYLNPP